MLKPIILGDQSGTTLGHGRSEAATDLLNADVAKLVMAIEALVAELTEIKPKLDRIEKTLSDVALGLGVTPR